MNVVDYLVETDTTTTFNDYDKKDNEQMYFQLCESCFWCASCIHLSSEEDITKCPYCNDFRVKSLPITNETNDYKT